MSAQINVREIRVKVIPNSKKESVVELPDGRFAVAVKDDRKAGKANARAIKVLAEYFSVTDEDITISKGHTSPTKTVRLKI